jgi:hypothetical protein
MITFAQIRGMTEAVSKTGHKWKFFISSNMPVAWKWRPDIPIVIFLIGLIIVFVLPDSIFIAVEAIAPSYAGDVFFIKATRLAVIICILVTVTGAGYWLFVIARS